MHFLCNIQNLEITTNVEKIKKTKKKKMKFIIILAFFILVIFSGCKKEFIYKMSGELGFSADTVKIDTIFTTFPSPSYRLFVYNKMNYGLKIKKIKLRGGENSEFQLIVNGIHGNIHENVILEPEDSIYIFVSLKSSEKEKIVEDFIEFELENKKETVVLQAFVRDAYFYRGVDSLFVFDCNTLLGNDKPHIIDGIAYVPQNCTLTIQAGAEIRFSSLKNQYAIPISQILVDGTLIVQGTKDNRVLFDTWRLDENYKEGSGQWYGLHFLKDSKNSKITYAVFKNGHIALRVDSLSTTNEPKLTIEQTEIRNFSNFGILGLGAHDQSTIPSIKAVNTLIHNCGQNNVGLFFGGSYEFEHCTFVNYSGEVRRSEPVLGISDYLEFEENGQALRIAYTIKATFISCIIFGSEEQEWKSDFKGNQIELRFENCLLKSKPDINVPGNDNLFNLDPRFVNRFERDFRLLEDSPCINKGKINTTVIIDILGNQRIQVPDIGAFEYQP